MTPTASLEAFKLYTALPWARLMESRRPIFIKIKFWACNDRSQKLGRTRSKKKFSGLSCTLAFMTCLCNARTLFIYPYTRGEDSCKKDKLPQSQLSRATCASKKDALARLLSPTFKTSTLYTFANYSIEWNTGVNTNTFSTAHYFWMLCWWFRFSPNLMKVPCWSSWSVECLHRWCPELKKKTHHVNEKERIKWNGSHHG